MRLIVGKKYYHQKNKREPVVGIEPTTGRLRSDYSTAELHRLISLSNVQNECFTTELHRPDIYLKTISNTLSEPQEVHWTQSIITLTNYLCQAFFWREQGNRTYMEVIEWDKKAEGRRSIS